MSTVIPTELPYDARNTKGFAAAVSAFPQTVVESGVLLVGDCSRCEHQIDVFVPTKDQTGALGVQPRGQRTTPEGKFVEQPVRCNCDMPHVGRPEGSDGCGAMGTIRVPS